MRVWIDATRGAGDLRVFGMPLLERLLRALRETGVALREVCIETRGAAGGLPADLAGSIPLRWSQGQGGVAQRLARALDRAGGEPLLVLSADDVVDTRVLRQLCATSGSVAFISGQGAERAAALRVEGELPDLAQARDDADLATIAEGAVRSGSAKRFSEDDFDAYIPMLRRRLPPYLFRIPDAASRDRVERFLFWSNYKGSTDFLTKYVYPPLVWAMVRPLARLRVHPNWVTALDWLATLAAVPFFASGSWLPGMALAYLMTVLDSVDGKLARLTYTSSRLGELLDHGLDIVHPPFWYAAWGYALGGGDLTSLPVRASLAMLGFYIADRVCTPVFKMRTGGGSIHAFTPLDERLRTVISRRNVNLTVLTVGLVVDAFAPQLRAAERAFYLVVLWQVVGFAWHLERVVQFWNARPAR